ncbi:MAG: serine/threonine-protein kinase [Planctomycetales bacterium]
MSSVPPDPSQPPPETTEAELFGLPVRDAGQDRLSRDPVELAATEYLAGLREGRNDTVESYAWRYPQYAEQIRKVLPLVAAMESWKSNKEFSGARRAVPADMNFERLGDCRLIRELGRGGMGIVYEAIRQTEGDRVAVKLLPWRFSTPRWRENFFREAQMMSRLRHTHLVPVYGYGEQEGWCYIIMQLVQGWSLDKVIRKLKSEPGEIKADEIRQDFSPHDSQGLMPAATHASAVFPAGMNISSLQNRKPPEKTNLPGGRVLRRNSWPNIARIGMQAASALQYAHKEGTLHRDIKPANLLLDWQGAVWIADFGIARQKDALLGKGEEELKGTLAYLAPEQLEGHVDERSDVYSLGVTLYELCTLQPAFDHSERKNLVDRLRNGVSVRPRQINPEIPVELDRIILRATSTNPQDRYQSAGDLLNALREFSVKYPKEKGLRRWFGSWKSFFPFRRA